MRQRLQKRGPSEADLLTFYHTAPIQQIGADTDGRLLIWDTESEIRHLNPRRGEHLQPWADPIAINGDTRKVIHFSRKGSASPEAKLRLELPDGRIVHAEENLVRIGSPGDLSDQSSFTIIRHRNPVTALYVMESGIVASASGNQLCVWIPPGGLIAAWQEPPTEKVLQCRLLGGVQVVAHGDGRIQFCDKDNQTRIYHARQPIAAIRAEGPALVVTLCSGERLELELTSAEKSSSGLVPPLSGLVPRVKTLDSPEKIVDWKVFNGEIFRELLRSGFLLACVVLLGVVFWLASFSSTAKAPADETTVIKTQMRSVLIALDPPARTIWQTHHRDDAHPTANLRQLRTALGTEADQLLGQWQEAGWSDLKILATLQELIDELPKEQ